MDFLASQMNRFERILFRVALVLTVVIVAVRLGFAVAMWYLHNTR